MKRQLTVVQPSDGKRKSGTVVVDWRGNKNYTRLMCGRIVLAEVSKIHDLYNDPYYQADIGTWIRRRFKTREKAMLSVQNSFKMVMK